MIEKLRALIMGLGIAGYAACSGSHGGAPPAPPTSPTPAPEVHEPVCVPPGLVFGCWHQPPGQGWQFIPAPVENALDCDGPVGAIQPVSGALGDRVNQAMVSAFSCYGGRCLIAESRFAVQRKLIDELRRLGLCAGQHEPGTSVDNPGSDEIAVATSRTTLREAYHVAVGPKEGPVTLLLSPQANREAYLPAGVPAPPGPGPTPTPAPSAGACSAPFTPKVDKMTGGNVINGWHDWTPQFYNGETKRWDGITITGYCDAIGFVGRLHCPARMECGEVPNPVAVKCEERFPCEVYGISGKTDGRPLVKSDGKVELHPENIFKARCSGCSWIQMCSSDGAVCSDKVAP